MATLNAGKTRRPSGTRAMPRATSWVGDRPATSSPSKRMVPESGFRRPAMVATVVVLPAPLSPKSTAVSPSSTAKLMPSRTGKP